MENKLIVKEVLKARKENNLERLEELAVENIDLVLTILEMEDCLVYLEYKCGTLAKPEYISVIKVKLNGKYVDLRNKIVKNLETLIGCWDKYLKHFELSIEPYRF